MARLRSKGKAFGASTEPEVTARTRRSDRIRHSPRSSVPVQSIEEDDTAPVRNKRRRSAAPAKSQIQPSLNKGRVTRSSKGDAPHSELPPPASRKRRSGDAEEQYLKRQRSTSHESGEEDLPQPNQEDEEASEDDESMPPLKEFLDAINNNIGASAVPNKRPSPGSDASLEKPAEIEDGVIPHAATSDEGNTKETIIAITEEPNGAAGDSAEPEATSEQPESVQSEVPQSAQPVLQPNTLQRESLDPGPKGRVRRKKKASYYELNSDSALSPNRSTQPVASKNTQVGASIYDVPDSPQKHSNQSAARNTQVDENISDVPDSPQKHSNQSAARNTQVDENISDVPDSPQKHSDQAATPEEAQNASVSGDEGRQTNKQGKQRSSLADRRRTNVSTQNQDAEYQEEDSQEDPQEDPQEEDHEEEDHQEFFQDSLMLDAPPDDQETADSIPTTHMKRACVQKLMHIMTLKGWMEGRRWKDDFVDQAADKSDLLKRQPNHPALSTRILVQLFDLYQLCLEIPASQKLDQLTYLREKGKYFSKLISEIRQSIDRFTSKINDNIEGANPEQVTDGYNYVVRIHRRIIPMLVLVLDATFEAGCRTALEKGKKAAQQTGEFTVYLLALLERAAGWAYRLSQTVEGWYELHPSEKERDSSEEAQTNRALFHSATIRLKQELKEARRDLDKPEITPEDLMQRDEAIRQEREAEKQQSQERKDLQMQRFLNSIQRINPYGRSARARPVRQQVPALHRANPTSFASSQQPSEHSYYEQHGWHYWEDDQILTLIRTTAHPNYDNVRHMFPDRNTNELRERSRYLKLVVRDKYNRKGIAPPGWCIDEE
ncbi:hypothetical protein FLONG3_10042 [Fusarium longipes]|uniref:Uncharacterized protein n=1 Tax=Fusarium longipes TaxID=694270 RepID=A0A395RSD3_9HYPO|nr:hypothetical protein FLONG3_10042 [Fusarium longipes]